MMMSGAMLTDHIYFQNIYLIASVDNYNSEYVTTILCYQPLLSLYTIATSSNLL